MSGMQGQPRKEARNVVSVTCNKQSCLSKKKYFFIKSGSYQSGRGRQQSRGLDVKQPDTAKDRPLKGIDRLPGLNRNR